MSFINKLFLVFILIVVNFSTLSAQVIQQIIVRGNRVIEAEAIIEKTSQREGKELREDRVAIDIKRLYGMGYFKQISMDFESGKLVITVEEKNLISEISFDGNSEFDDDDLSEILTTKTKQVLSLSKIKQDRAKIVKKYEEKGYYLADVGYDLIDDLSSGKKAWKKLVFKVNEGEQVKIRKILFSGNNKFSARELKRTMISTEGHLLSPMTGGGLYRELAFQRDIQALSFYYADNGYIKAQFPQPKVLLSQDRRYIDIIIQVIEGAQYRMGELDYDLAGDQTYTTERLKKEFSLQTGSVFKVTVLQKQIAKLSDLYGDKGYAYANIIPGQALDDSDPKNPRVNLKFSVEKGPLVKWGRIDVKGNYGTHDRIVRRELPFAEGDLYNATKKKKGFNRIKRLGFFGDNIEFLESSPKGRRDVKNLTIKVEEKPTGSLNVSAGFGSASKWLVGAQVNQNNLFGQGYKLGLNAQLNSISQEVNLNFTNPRFNDSSWIFGINVFHTRDQVGFNPKTYDKKLTGGSFTFGKEIFENFALTSEYRLEHNKLKNIVNPIVLKNDYIRNRTVGRDPEFFVSSLKAKLAYDTRNNRLDPSAGMYTALSAEIAGIGGLPFQKYNLGLRYYQKLFWNIVFKSRLEMGYVVNAIGSEEVPDTERYSLGGIFSLRGYDSSSVGSTLLGVPNLRLSPPQNQDIVIGGKAKFLTNLELEFPLIPDAKVKGVFFFDAGSAGDTFFDNDFGPAILANYGWGLRWFSPMGPLRFEVGFPLHKIPTSDDKVHYNFVIAPTF